MDCQKTRENFPDYRDGRIEPEGREAVEAHLKDCRACRSQLEAFSIVDAELNRWNEVEPSPWLEQKIMARLDTEQEGRRRPRLMALLQPQWAAMIVLFIVAGLGSWLMTHRREHPVEPSRPVGNQTTSQAASSVQRVDSPVIRPSLKISKEQTYAQDLVLKTNAGEEISQEDLTLLENLDLLEDFDLLNPAESGETAAPKKSAPGSR